MDTEDSLFRIPDLWKLSSFTQQVKDRDDIFQIDTTLLSLGNKTNSHEDNHFDFTSNLPDLNKVPTTILQQSLEDISAPFPASIPQEQPSNDQSSNDPPSTSEVWSLSPSLLTPIPPPRYHTWSALSHPSHPTQHPSTSPTRTYEPPPSSSAPEVFDAILSATKHASPGVLPQPLLTRALASLALGRSSTFFTWNERTWNFESVLPGVPASGYSAECFGSVCKEICDFGGRIVRLRRFVRAEGERDGKVRGGSAGLALRLAVGCVLDGVEGWLAERIGRCRSILRVRELIEKAGRVMEVVVDVVVRVKGKRSGEEVIEAVAGWAREVIAVQNELAELVREVLARVSLPWLQQLRREVGLDEETPSSLWSNDENADIESSRLLNDEDRQIVTEAKTALRMRRHHLARDQSQIKRRRDLVVPSVKHNKPKSEQTKHYLNSESSTAGNDPVLLNPGEDDIYNFSALAQQMTLPLAWTLESQTSDRLTAATTRCLRHGQADRLQSTTNVFELIVDSSFEQIRPAIVAQTRALNQEILTILFNEYDLLDHLQLNRDFQLLGNGKFIARLNTALFSSETQTSERRRGNMPTAGEMGLRLGVKDGQRWPPASSELRLSLMGMLDEVYGEETRLKAKTIGKTTSLPGELNFAIRELTEEEIERTLDPSSIYALDFLKLHYNPPPLLDEVLTEDVMAQYDTVFRHLLPMLRLLHVTSSLKQAITSRKLHMTDEHESAGSMTSLANSAHNFISILTSHFMDVCIASAWNDFMIAITDIQVSLDLPPSSHAPVTPSRSNHRPASSHPGHRKVHSTASVSSLRHLHSQCLDRIRRGMFLKAKSAPVRATLNEALTAVLQHGTAVYRACESGGLRPHIKLAEEEIKTIIRHFEDALEQYVTKLDQKGGEEREFEEVEIGRLLLARLRWRDGDGAM